MQSKCHVVHLCSDPAAAQRRCSSSSHSPRHRMSTRASCFGFSLAKEQEDAVSRSCIMNCPPPPPPPPFCNCCCVCLAVAVFVSDVASAGATTKEMTALTKEKSPQQAGKTLRSQNDRSTYYVIMSLALTGHTRLIDVS